MITARLRGEARRAIGGDAVAKLCRLAQEAAAGSLRVVPIRSPDAVDEKDHRHRLTMRGGRRTTCAETASCKPGRDEQRPTSPEDRTAQDVARIVHAGIDAARGEKAEQGRDDREENRARGAAG